MLLMLTVEPRYLKFVTCIFLLLMTKSPSVSLFRIKSVISLNNVADNESPYLTLHLILNSSLILLFTLIFAVVLCSVTAIYHINLFGTSYHFWQSSYPLSTYRIKNITLDYIHNFLKYLSDNKYVINCLFA